MTRELVIFDLDNTLIKGQSQKFLLTYAFNKRLISLFFYLKVFSWFVLYKIGLVKNPKKIMEYSFSFLKGKSVGEFEKIIDDFFEEKLKKNIFKEVIDLIKNHKAQNRKILIVSNAVEFIPKKITKFLGGGHFIGTRLSVHNGKFTGEIEGDIIYGENKVIAIRKFVERNNLSLKNSWAYSDHDSDTPLLEIVDYPFAVNPNRGLYKKAKKEKWPILIFKETI